MVGQDYSKLHINLKNCGSVFEEKVRSVSRKQNPSSITCYVVQGLCMCVDSAYAGLHLGIDSRAAK